MNGTEREQVITLPRAAVDLLENNEAVPVPFASLHFTAHGTPDPPAVFAAIASALPCTWQGDVHHNPHTETDYYRLLSEPPSGRTRVQVDAHADEVCTAQGTRTMTDWAPSPAIAALLESSTKDESGASQ